MTGPILVPGGEPFLALRGSTACLLVHGFTAMPEEMRLLGDDLAGAGHTVLGIRLAGHGTEPCDLFRVRPRDWLASVADGVAILRDCSERVVLVGQSLGGVVALTAASRLVVDGVVVLASPFELARGRPRPRLPWRVEPKKGVTPHPDLGLRREAGYPAYAGVPPRVEREVRLAVREMRAALSAVDVPVLLVSSEADPWFPPDHGRRLEASIRNARLVVLERAGHGITLDPERAEAFRAVREFVASL